MIQKSDYRVYYEDTDAWGIMYHASFIRFCERGRAEYLRAGETQCSTLAQEQGVGFVVRHLAADYFLPAYLDDLLTVETHTKALKNSSIMMGQSIFRQDSVLFTMDVTLVCVDLTGKPVRVPPLLRDAFAPIEGDA